MDTEPKQIVQSNNQGLKNKFPRLFTVSPLSKYLAMLLFILMPFVGGLVGYQIGLYKTLGTGETAMIDQQVPIGVSSRPFDSETTYEQQVKIQRQQRHDLAFKSVQTCFPNEFDSLSFDFFVDGTSKNPAFRNIWWPDTYRDSSHMYFFMNMDVLEAQAAVDPCLNVLKIDSNSFESLGGNYYKDKDNFYFYINMNVVEFFVIDTDQKTFEVLSNGFARDEDSLYFNGNSVDGADPDTWQVINNTAYSRDAHSVYLLRAVSHDSLPLQLLTIRGADPTSFEPVDPGAGIAKDRYRVYLYDKILEGVDPQTLRLFDFSGRLIADKNGVYNNGLKLDYIDAPSFTIGSTRSDFGSTVVSASDKNKNYLIKIDGSDAHLLTVTAIE